MYTFMKLPKIHGRPVNGPARVRGQEGWIPIGSMDFVPYTNTCRVAFPARTSTLTQIMHSTMEGADFPEVLIEGHEKSTAKGKPKYRLHLRNARISRYALLNGKKTKRVANLPLTISIDLVFPKWEAETFGKNGKEHSFK